ncbi:hypothetical protein DFJ77DRAFT_464697 [Powellomyces hirtus]|nr:hypothetical protein DFJ77DRAFT_464697 [Powellomyces hirtus]
MSLFSKDEMAELYNRAARSAASSPNEHPRNGQRTKPATDSSSGEESDSGTISSEAEETVLAKAVNSAVSRKPGHKTKVTGTVGNEQRHAEMGGLVGKVKVHPPKAQTQAAPIARPVKEGRGFFKKSTPPTPTPTPPEPAVAPAPLEADATREPHGFLRLGQSSRDLPIRSSTTNLPTQPLPSLKPDMEELAQLFQTLENKKYTEGYIYKKNETGLDGRSLTSRDAPAAPGDVNGEWVKWWTELRGTRLRMWRVPDHITSLTYDPAPTVDKVLRLELDPAPSTIATIKIANPNSVTLDVSDSVTEVLPDSFHVKQGPGLATPPPVPYTSLFALSTAGSNLFYLASLSAIQVNTWVAAIRLAVFESARLNEFFTLKMLNRPAYAPAWKEIGVMPFSSASHKSEIKFEGLLDVKSTYAAGWRTYHVVVKRSGGGGLGIGKKLFGGKKKEAGEQAEPSGSKRPYIAFYENKADIRKKRAAFVIDTVAGGYIIPPEPFALVEEGAANVVRLECKISAPNSGKEGRSSASTQMTSQDSLPEMKDTFAFVGNRGFAEAAADPIGACIMDEDVRPAPYFLDIRGAEAAETARWIIAIYGAFNLDSNLSVREKNMADLGCLHPPTHKKSSTRSAIPSNISDSGSDKSDLLADAPLFLCTEDISGLRMQGEGYPAVSIRLGQVVQDKLAAKRGGFSGDWDEAVWEGENGRREYERKEVEHKTAELIQWLNRVVVPSSPVDEARNLDNVPASTTVLETGADAPAEGVSEAVSEAVADGSPETVPQSVGGYNTPHEGADDVVQEYSELDLIKGYETIREQADTGLTITAEAAHERNSVDATPKEGENVPADVADGPVAKSISDSGPVSATLSDGDAPMLESTGADVMPETREAVEATEPIAVDSSAPTQKVDQAGADSVTEEKSAVPSVNSPAQPQMVMIPVPTLQPNGQWGWQYQYVDASQLPGGMLPQPGAKAANGTDEESDSGEESDTDNSDEEDGSESDDEDDSNEDDDDEDESDADDDAPQTAPPFPMMSSMHPGMMMPPGMMMMMPGMSMPNVTAEGQPADGEDGEEGIRSLPQPPFGMMPPPGMPMMPGLPPVFMGPNGILIGANGMPLPMPGMQNDDGTEGVQGAEDEAAPGGEYAPTPQSLLANLEARGNKSARRDGPLVQLAPGVAEAQTEKLTQPAFIPQAHHGPQSGPLLGHVLDSATQRKPKLVGGLLGQVDRMEKEKEMLKKMGVWRPTGAPTGGYIPTYLRGGMGGSAAARNSFMAMGGPMSPGMGMPPGMMPMGAWGGLPYPMSEFGDPHEDPSMAAQREELRKEWLEKERMKERQRATERNGEYYVQPSYYPPTVASAGFRPGAPYHHASYPAPYGQYPSAAPYPMHSFQGPIAGPPAPVWRRANSCSGSDGSESEEEVARRRRERRRKAGEDSDSTGTGSSSGESESGPRKRAGSGSDSGTEEEGAVETDSDDEVVVKRRKPAKGAAIGSKSATDSGTDSEDDASEDDSSLDGKRRKRAQAKKGKQPVKIQGSRKQARSETGTETDDSEDDEDDDSNSDSDSDTDDEPLVVTARGGKAAVHNRQSQFVASDMQGGHYPPHGGYGGSHQYITPFQQHQGYPPQGGYSPYQQPQYHPQHPYGGQAPPPPPGPYGYQQPPQPYQGGPYGYGGRNQPPLPMHLPQQQSYQSQQQPQPRRPKVKKVTRRSDSESRSDDGSVSGDDDVSEKQVTTSKSKSKGRSSQRAPKEKHSSPKKSQRTPPPAATSRPRRKKPVTSESETGSEEEEDDSSESDASLPTRRYKQDGRRGPL